MIIQYPICCALQHGTLQVMAFEFYHKFSIEFNRRHCVPDDFHMWCDTVENDFNVRRVQTLIEFMRRIRNHKKKTMVFDNDSSGGRA